MRRFVAKNWLPAGMALIVLIVTLSLGEQMSKRWPAYTPAIEWHGVEVMTREVAPGGDLVLVYSATVNKTCPADLRGFLIAKDGTAPVRYPVVAGGYSKPSQGPISIQVRITVPAMADAGLGALLPGPYVYRTLATRYCPEGVEEDNAIPEAAFTLVGP